MLECPWEVGNGFEMLRSHPRKDRPQHRIGRYAIKESLKKHLKPLAAAGPPIERGNFFICHALIMHPIADTGRSTLVVYLCLWLHKSARRDMGRRSITKACPK